MSTLVFLTHLLLLSSHNVNRFVASFSCNVVIFALSYRILYRVNCAKIKDTNIPKASFYRPINSKISFFNHENGLKNLLC